MKYLLYDNIVRGAGLGHTLACYNYGLQLARSWDMELLTKKLIPGHGFNSMMHTTIEQELGIPIVDDEHLDKLFHSNLVEIIPYADHHPVENDFRSTREIFKQWYDDADNILNNRLAKDITSITISIRRGDLACSDRKHPMRSRLLPLNFYLDELNRILEHNEIEDYHLTVSCDTRNGTSLVDENNNVLDVEDVFKNHLKHFTFLPSDMDGEKTFIFFHHAVSSDFFISSNSGFSKIINEVYR